MDEAFNFPGWLDLVLVGSALLVVALIGFVGSALFIQDNLKAESSRKLIHIGLALWIAVWRFFLPANIIIVASLLLALGVFVAKKMAWLKAIHGVGRATHGEIIYALGVTVTVILFQEPAVFALAILNLGCADGLAALIGTRYGKKKYALWGDPKQVGKTLAGSSASFGFALISGLIFWLFFVAGPLVWPLVLTHVIAAAFLISAFEFVSRRGFDNLLIPVITGFCYSPVII